MGNLRWAVISIGFQFFVFWWLVSDVGEGRTISIIPAVVIAASFFLTFLGWTKLDGVSRRIASRKAQM
jgi:hypothetical protein